MTRTFVITPELSERQKEYQQARRDLDDAGDRRDSTNVDAAEERMADAERDLLAAGESVPKTYGPPARLVELDKAKNYLITATFSPETTQEERASVLDGIDDFIRDIGQRSTFVGVLALPSSAKIEVTEAPWNDALQRYVIVLNGLARQGSTGRQEQADALRKALALGIASEKEARLVLTAQGVWDGLFDKILGASGGAS